MDARTLGIIGGIIGSIIGLTGGIIGTYFSIKRTSSPAERNFVIKCSIGVWAAVLIVAALNVFGMLGYVTEWLGLAALILVLILIAPVSRWINRQQITRKFD